MVSSFKRLDEKILAVTRHLLEENEELVVVGSAALRIAYGVGAMLHDADFISLDFQRTVEKFEKSWKLRFAPKGFECVVDGVLVQVGDSSKYKLLKSYFTTVNGVKTVVIEDLLASKLVKIAHFLAPIPTEAGYWQRYRTPGQLLDVFLILEKYGEAIDWMLVRDICAVMGWLDHIERLKYHYMAEPMHYAYALVGDYFAQPSEKVRDAFHALVERVLTGVQAP